MNSVFVLIGFLLIDNNFEAFGWFTVKAMGIGRVKGEFVVRPIAQNL